MTSAGKSLRAAAPALSAAKPSVGVATPGRQARPAALAARTTSGSPCGMTTSRPPASCSLRTSAGSSTVPAPTTTSGGSAFASLAMLANGSGELSGTSIRLKPASTSVVPTASASSGTRPRRMATSGRASKAASKASRVGIAGPQEARGAGEGEEAERGTVGRAGLGGEAEVAGGLEIEGSERAAAEHDHGLGPLRSRGGSELGADQEAAEVGGERRLRQVAREPQGACAEKVVEEAAGTGRAARRLVEAPAEGARVGRPLAHQAAEDAVAAQHVVDLAGHVGGEGRDAAAPDLRPFAVCAGEDETAVARAARAQLAQDLGLLAAHHVGHAGRVAGQEAGRDADGAARRPLDLDQAARELGGTGRALGVGRLAPTLAAADHA